MLPRNTGLLGWRLRDFTARLEEGRNISMDTYESMDLSTTEAVKSVIQRGFRKICEKPATEDSLQERRAD